MKTGVNYHRLLTNIYGLSDPRKPEMIRYIGKTIIYIEDRLNAHISDANKKELRGKGQRKNNWIYGLLEQGVKPITSLIAIVRTSQWEEKEKHYIKLFKSFGAKLTNGTDGGDTGPVRFGEDNGFYGKEHTEDTKQYMRELWEARLADPNYVHPIKGRSRTKEEEIKRKQTELERWDGWHWKNKNHKQISKDKTSQANKGRINITNGLMNTSIKPDSPIPDGWFEGCALGYRYINNGDYNILILEEQETPEGWKDKKLKHRFTVISREVTEDFESKGMSINPEDLKKSRMKLN